MDADHYVELGAYLTGFEAERLAAAFAAGDTTSQALREIHATRRGEARRLLAAADLGPQRVDVAMAVLRAIAGARSLRPAITPVWTMPGAEATIGRLTGQVRRLIADARMSVVCSSFNFTPHSEMWTALCDASIRSGVSVTVYLDARAGSAQQVAVHLPRASVYRTRTLPGMPRPLVSHAKFVIVDRTLTLLTSANFSHNAEHSNIELGILVQDAALAESIESLLRGKHGVLYELVPSG
jgi:phosphatidylserine/phosphatidylglycerophosphate/cardiolipin synthase-like enzyme